MKKRKLKRLPIDPILRDNILTLALVCAEVRQVKLSTLSGECHGDPKCLEKLKAGEGSITGRKYDSTMLWLDQWFADNPEVAKPPIKEPFSKRGASA